MTFSVQDFVNNITDKLLSYPILGKVASNPLLSSAILTVFILIIIYLTVSVSTVRDCMKSSVWIFLFLFGALCVHDKILSMELRDEKAKKSASLISRNITGGTTLLHPEAVDIGPRV